MLFQQENTEAEAEAAGQLLQFFVQPEVGPFPGIENVDRVTGEYPPSLQGNIALVQ